MALILWQCPKHLSCGEVCIHKEPHEWQDGDNACDFKCKGEMVYCWKVEG